MLTSCGPYGSDQSIYERTSEIIKMLQGINYFIQCTIGTGKLLSFFAFKRGFFMIMKESKYYIEYAEKDVVFNIHCFL